MGVKITDIFRADIPFVGEAVQVRFKPILPPGSNLRFTSFVVRGTVTVADEKGIKTKRFKEEVSIAEPTVKVNLPWDRASGVVKVFITAPDVAKGEAKVEIPGGPRTDALSPLEKVEAGPEEAERLFSGGALPTDGQDTTAPTGGDSGNGGKKAKKKDKGLNLLVLGAGALAGAALIASSMDK